MQKLLFLFFTILLVSCQSKKKPGSSLLTGFTDTIRTRPPATTDLSNRLSAKDSLCRQRERDSFYSIKPVVVLTSDSKGDCYNKKIALLIDTTDISKRKIIFSDTTIYQQDKHQNLLLSRQICFNKSYKIEIVKKENLDSNFMQLFINGKKMKPVGDMDISLVEDYPYADIDLNPEESYMITFGRKEYLCMTGYLHNCNGNGCGILYYLLYDPAIKKAMLLRQYRSDFIVGYDSKAATPVFINMHENSYDDWLDCFNSSGRAYRFNHNGRVTAIKDNQGRPFYFSGYYKGGQYDSFYILKKNFPVNVKQQTSLAVRQPGNR